MVIIDYIDKAPKKKGLRAVLASGFSNYCNFKASSNSSDANKWNIFWISILSVLVFIFVFGFCGAVYYDELISNTCSAYCEANDSPYAGKSTLYGLLCIVGGFLLFATLITIFIPTLAINYRNDKSIINCLGIVFLYFVVCAGVAYMTGFISVIIIPNH